MQYAAALIEYVITGLTSLIWIALLVHQGIDLTIFDYGKYKELLVIIILPVSYILGIYVDVTSSYLLRRLSNLGTYFGNFKFDKQPFTCLKAILIGTPKANPYARSAEILSYSTTDIIRTMETYISRDRIARGMALNSLITGAILLSSIKISNSMYLALASFIITFISTLVWMRLRRLSKEFKTQALLQLKKRNAA